MARDSKSVLARSKVNGGLYTIGESFFKKYPEKWELAEDGSEDRDMDYFELKTKLSDLGVDFKGNAKKEDLLQLYKEATGE